MAVMLGVYPSPLSHFLFTCEEAADAFCHQPWPILRFTATKTRPRIHSPKLRYPPHPFTPRQQLVRRQFRPSSRRQDIHPSTSWH